MNELLSMLIGSCQYLYADHGFRFADSSLDKESGDASVTLAQGDLVFIFSRDGDGSRSFLHIGTRKQGKIIRNSVYSFDLVRQLLTEEQEYHRLFDADNIRFLSERIEEVLTLFAPNRVRTTLEQLRDLHKVRNQILLDELFAGTK